MSSGSQTVVGKSAAMRSEWSGSVGAFCAIVRPDRDQIDPAYLALYMRSEAFRSWTRTSEGVNIKNIRHSELLTHRLPVPSLSEQRRIVDLLSRAEDIVRMRRKAEAKAKEIFPALFVHMFGDPGTNSKGWERRLIGQVVKSIDSGKSPNCEDRVRKSGEWGVLKLGAVTWGNYDESECKVLPPGVEPFTASEVHAGDVLISRKNTFELVGASAYVWETAGRMLLPDLIFRLDIADASVLDPIYLWALLSTDTKRSQLRGMASGAAASMPNISKGRLATLTIELPPIRTQRVFRERVVRANDLNRQQWGATCRAELAFQSLLAGVFGGGGGRASARQLPHRQEPTTQLPPAQAEVLSEGQARA